MYVFANDLFLLNTTESTSATTGSCVLAGGTSLAKSLHVGQSLTVQGAVVGTGQFTIGDTVSVVNTTDTTSLSTGAFVVNGGMTVTGHTVCGNTIHVLDNSDAVSLNVASVVVHGGISVTKQWRVGAGMTVYDTTDATDASTGAVVLAGGGIQITKTTTLAGTLRVLSTNSHTIAGGLGVGQTCTVGTDFTLQGDFYVGALPVPATPVEPSDIANKGYVDALSYLAATAGLALTTNTLSVTTAQPNLVSVGTLTTLTCSGDVTLTSTVNAASTVTGALKIAGGLGVGGNITIGANTTVNGTTVFYGAVTVPAPPVNGTDAAPRSYIDAVSYLTAGTGLEKSGNTLTRTSTLPHVTSLGTLTSLTVSGLVTVTATTISVSPSTGCVIVAGGVGIGGNCSVGGPATFTGDVSFSESVTVSPSYTPSTETDAATKGYIDALTWLMVDSNSGISRSGNTITLATSLPNVTSLGTLSSLLTSTLVVSNTTESSSSTTGSLILQGGIGVAKNVLVGGTLTVTGATVFSGSSISTNHAPTNATDAATKGYVDGLTCFAAGTGLSLTTNTLAINANQPAIVSLGTLSSLTVSGILNITNTTESDSISTGALVVSGGVGISKNVIVSGNVVVAALLVAQDPTDASNAATKQSVDNLSWFHAGPGLTVSGSTVAMSASQPDITSVGTLTALDVSGLVSITKTTDASSAITGALIIAGGCGLAGTMTIGGELIVDGTSTFNASINVSATPNNPSDAVPKSYIDTVGTFTAGSGLTLNAKTFSVNPDQSNYITSIGTLTACSIAGTASFDSTTNATNISTGMCLVAGGLGVVNNITIGGTLNIAGTTTFHNSVTLGTVPTNPSDAVTKTYIDGLEYLTFGSGFVVSGTNPTTLNVSSTMATTQVGTITNLTVAGTVNITNTTPSTSESTGSLVVAGGVSTVKNSVIGGSLTINGTSTFTSTVNAPSLTPTTTTDAVTKSSVDSIDTRISLGPGLSYSGTPGTSLTVSLDANLPQITNLGPLTTLTVVGTVTVTATTPSTSTSTGALTTTGGMGVGGTTMIGGTLWSEGPITISNTTDAMSPTTGILQIAGGMAVTKNTFIGGNLFIGGNATFTGSITVATPVNATDAITKNYCDATVQDLSLRNSVVAATTTSGTLATSFVAGSSIDDVTLVTGYRILIKNQMNGIENGIYMVNATGAPTRAADVAAGSNAAGIFTFVEQGTMNGLSGWIVATPTAVVNTNIVTWTQFSGQHTLMAGTGLVNTTNTFSVDANQPTITSVGTLTSLAVSGTVLLQSAIDSTTASTGALVLPNTGGIGIAKNTSIGTSLVVNGSNSTLQGTVTGPTPVAGTDLATRGYVTSLTWLTPGSGLTLSGTDPGTLSINTTQSGLAFTGLTSLTVNDGAVTITNMTNASSVSTGALIVAGGLGCTGITIGSTLFTNTFVSINSETGSGGWQRALDIVKPNQGTNEIVASWIGQDRATLNNAGYVGFKYVSSGNTSNALVMGFDGTNPILSLPGTYQFLVHTTTESTSTGTGSLVIAGGVGIAKSLYCGSIVTLTSPTESTSATTGSIQIPGGMSLTTGKLSVGGIQTINTGIHMFTSTNVAAPSVNITSSGTRIIINNTLSSTTCDVAIGVESTGPWFSIPNTTNSQWQWYIGATNIMSLDTRGNATFPSTVSLASYSADGPALTGGTLIYEDLSQASLLSGSLSQNAFYTQANGYVTLTPSTGSQRGILWWALNPGPSWTCSFDFHYGGTADFIAFGCYQNNTDGDGTDGYINSGGYTVMFSEWINAIVIAPPSVVNTRVSPGSGSPNTTGTAVYSGYRTLAPSNTWHHACIVFKYGSVAVFVNGAFITSLNVPFNTISSTISNQNTYIRFISMTGGQWGIHAIRSLVLQKGTGCYDTLTSARTGLRFPNNLAFDRAVQCSSLTVSNTAGGSSGTKVLASHYKSNLAAMETAQLFFGNSTSNGVIASYNPSNAGFSNSPTFSMGLNPVGNTRMFNFSETSKSIYIPHNTDATAANTGSVQLAGGLYVAKNLVCTKKVALIPRHTEYYGTPNYYTPGNVSTSNLSTSDTYFYVSVTSTAVNLNSTFTWDAAKLNCTVTGVYLVKFSGHFTPTLGEAFISKNFNDLNSGGANCLALTTRPGAFSLSTTTYMTSSDFFTFGLYNNTGTMAISRVSISVTLLYRTA